MMFGRKRKQTAKLIKNEAAINHAITRYENGIFDSKYDLVATFDDGTKIIYSEQWLPILSRDKTVKKVIRKNTGETVYQAPTVKSTAKKAQTSSKPKTSSTKKATGKIVAVKKPSAKKSIKKK